MRNHGFEGVIGRSSALLNVLDSATRAAATDASVLILGEMGTGKELLARAIHSRSPRRERPLEVINCAGIPRDLLEAELFGYARGAFSGVNADHPGKVEIADGGTILLDEIGELPLDLQVRILRLIQDKEIERIGSSRAVPVDLRIIAATDRDLEGMAEAGTFRRDLYYRLAVVPLVLPPLRERMEDIWALTDNFLQESKLRHGKPDMHLPAYVLSHFDRYHWPGNIRELQNVVDRLVELSFGGHPTIESLPEFLRSEPPIEQPNHGFMEPMESADPREMDLESTERNLIVEALRKFQWNQLRAAQYLGITRKTLLHRVAKYGIENEGSASGDLSRVKVRDR